MGNYLVVIGAAIGAGLVAFLGYQWGWPFLIGFAIGAYCGHWNHDLIAKEAQRKASRGSD